jgi:hypothetical protein
MRRADHVDAPGAAREHLLDPAEVDEAARRLLAGDAQHQVVGVVLAQRVVEDVRGEGRLPAGLAQARQVALDQPGDGRGVAEGALHHRVLREPALEPVAQALGRQQRRGVGHRVEPPDQQRVVVGDEAERREARRLHAPGHQQAERLVRVAAGEAVEAEMVPVAARETSRPAAGRAGQAAHPRLGASQSAHVARAGRPSGRGSASSATTRCESRVEVASLVP